MILNLSSQHSNRLVLVKKAEVNFIDVESILYIEKLQRKTFIVTPSRSFTTTTSLKEITSLLPARLFFRSHKSYLVNILKIKDIELYSSASYTIKFFDYKDRAMMTRDKLNALIDMLNNRDASGNHRSAT
ncbi:hypothetical protein GKZ89_14690 [Bacillus mangrovi]|uniref:HTH LytTR-type domain-containing protein n=1 Tax=Metabacillus mangrovi TaxID=1491830 RepID=A0A7X2S6N1_9BACI|nr:LytTR family DNA-binding domain-containing protein [Metabacillus mangrovi]MTH54649.1 hypothetical protein [Metabacillus mangrovi]